MTEFHPELRRVARWLPRGIGTPFWARIMQILPRPTATLPSGFSLTEHRLDDTGSLSARVIGPVPGNGLSPVILWMHGGGYIAGNARQDDVFCLRLAQRTGATVVAVDYRVAPEHPFPTPLNDCMAAFEFIHREASRFNLDPTRLVIAGQSAGGGLAAALALLVHDRGLPPPCLQLLVYPMLDDRTTQRKIDGKFHRIWNQVSNLIGWKAYLGSLYGGEDVPDIAAPARRVDLSGLPTAWIGVGTVDLFHDEVVDYAARLEQAGVPTEVEIIKGAYHGFDVIAQNASISRIFFEKQVAAIQRAFELRTVSP